MRTALIVVFVGALALCGWRTSADEPGEALGPYTTAGNFSVDLFGAVDTRPSTWGRTDVAFWRQQLTPPAGYRVRVLEVAGDFVAWPTDYGIGPVRIDPGRCYGVLAGLQITDAEGNVPGGSRHGLGPLLADDTIFYVQGAACGPAAINKDYRVDLRGVENNLLSSNNMLAWKVASYLSDVEYPIHVEVTYGSMKLAFEKE